ncbi:MAG: hypothetical protein ACRD1K_15055 [Acidimicrobiales bacterium]
MNTGARLAAYGLALAAALGGGAAVGAAVGPLDIGGDGHNPGHDPGNQRDSDQAGLPAGGLLVSQDGYTLRTDERGIEGPDGHAVESYQEQHDRELHLIVVSSDLARFAHVHPARDGGSTWSVDLAALATGGYRAYADFRPTGGDQLTLGINLATLEGEVAGTGSSGVTVTVRRDGRVVTTQPYLGAAGNLVAIATAIWPGRCASPSRPLPTDSTSTSCSTTPSGPRRSP